MLDGLLIGACNPVLRPIHACLIRSRPQDRALGWDLLPPGTPEQTFGNFKTPPPTPRITNPRKSGPRGSPKPPAMDWAAGIQYDRDIHRANTVLANLSSF